MYNSTVLHALPANPTTYRETYDIITEFNSHLNILERLWAAWYAYMQNDVLATGIMSFVWHEVIYFGRSVPWIIIGMIPWFNRYKIQAVRPLKRCYALGSPILIVLLG